MDDYKRIIDQAIDMGAIAFSFNGGEPFIQYDKRKSIFDMVQYAKDAGALHVNVNSNGVVLEAMAEKILESPIDTINISLDSYDPEVYAKVRGIDAVPMILRGIKKYNTLKKERGGKGPKIGISIVVNSENWRQIPETLKFLKELGVSHVGLAPMQIAEENMFTLEGEELPENVKETDELRQVLADCVEKYPELLKEPKEYILGIADYFANPFVARNDKSHIQSFTLTVDPYGNVRPHEYGTGKIGNLKERSLRGIWFSDKFKEVREELFVRPPAAWAISIQPINIMINNYRKKSRVFHAVKETISYSKRRRMKNEIPNY